MDYKKAFIAALFLVLTTITVAQQKRTLKEKSLEKAATGFSFSGSYKMQDFGVMNEYMKVISDSFNLASPLHFADNYMSYGIAYDIKNPVVETELSVDYMRVSSTGSNTNGTNATMINSAFTYGLGFNFYPVKFFFVGTTLSVSNHKLKSTITVGAPDIELAGRLLVEPEDRPFSGFSVNMRLQTGIFIPFSRKDMGAGLRIMPYYDLSSKYDFTKKINGAALQTYSGNTKVPGSGFGVKASLVIMFRHYEAGSKVAVELQNKTTDSDIEKPKNKYSYIWCQVWHMTYPSEIYSIDYATVLSPTELTEEEVMSVIKKPHIRIGMTSVLETIEICPNYENCGSLIQSFGNKYYPSSGAVNCGTYQY